MLDPTLLACTARRQSSSTAQGPQLHSRARGCGSSVPASHAMPGGRTGQMARHQSTRLVRCGQGTRCPRAIRRGECWLWHAPERRAYAPFAPASAAAAVPAPPPAPARRATRRLPTDASPT
eukprot:scaffold160482_cov32-Tisochrysis_lutea.AAC.3